MLIEETLNTLSTQAMFAILGSVVVITTGILGYLLRINSTNVNNTSKTVKEDIFIKFKEIHTLISELRDRVYAVESEIKVLTAGMSAEEYQLHEHEGRNAREISQLNAKVEKITELLLRVLSDDKL
jgi:hypothetical protein